MRQVSRSRRASFAMLIAVALITPFLLYVAARLEIVQTGYRIDALEDRLVELERRHRALRLERSQLSALPHIEAQAKRLGLEPLPLANLVVIEAAAPPAPLEPAEVQP